MHTFDMLVVGASGGIDETDLSAYLLKPVDSEWSDGIVALEAGSGQGALARILRDNPTLLGEDNDYTAADLYNSVVAYVISHAHLDHTSSLILAAGSCSGRRKRIYAAKDVLDALMDHIFQGTIWPQLASFSEDDASHLYLLKEIRLKYQPIHCDISLRRMPVSHGDDYESSAFFIRHDPSQKEFLFFGDVAPDKLSKNPRLGHVWAETARKFPEQLSTIFIECSYPSGRPDRLLFGHLSPEHLLDELTTLATEVALRDSRKNTLRRPKKKQRSAGNPDALKGKLDGLRVVIIHCKTDLKTKIHPRETIVQQVKDLVKQAGLGAEVIAAVQGMHISI